MATRGARIAVVGATGALGTEVLALLDASSLRIGQLVLSATDRSFGEDVEFQGEVIPVGSELPALLGLDLVICCAPAAAARDVVRSALHAEVPCIDASGALQGAPDVPLRLAPDTEGVETAPLVASPVGAALTWAPVLRALRDLAPLRRVQGTVLDAASATGRPGIEALSIESLALFNQQELPTDGVERRPLAFDCHPSSGELDAEARSDRERQLASSLERLLGGPLPVSAAWVQVPAFVGQLSALNIQFDAAVDPEKAALCLAAAPGVELWPNDDEGPNLRAVAGRDRVVAGHPRRDPVDASALRLWIGGDLLRLAAGCAVALAAARLGAS